MKSPAQYCENCELERSNINPREKHTGLQFGFIFFCLAISSGIHQKTHLSSSRKNKALLLKPSAEDEQSFNSYTEGVRVRVKKMTLL